MSQFNGRAEKSVLGPDGSLNQTLERSVEKFPLETSWITQMRLITEMITISRRSMDYLHNGLVIAVPVPEGPYKLSTVH